MVTMLSPHPKAAQRKLVALRQKLRLEHYARKLWEKVFSDYERKQLGPDFYSACAKVRCSAGLWASVKGVSLSRAVIEVAAELQLLPVHEAIWLLSALGLDKDGCPCDWRAAVKAGHLVLIEQPKEMYWGGKKVDVSQMTPAIWKYWCKLTTHAKHGRPLSRFDLDDCLEERYLSKQKSRLINECGLPLDLGERIVSTGRGDQRLDLHPSMIHRVQGIQRIEFQEITNRNPSRA